MGRPLLVAGMTSCLRSRGLGRGKGKRGRESLLLTGDRNSSELPSSHDVYGLPAAVTRTTCSIGPWYAIAFLRRMAMWSAMLARESCPACRGLAMVQPLAPRPGRRGGPRRGTGALAGRLASACPVRGDGGGVGGAAAFGTARHTVWRGGMARAHGKASGPAVHATCSWSTAKISPQELV